MEPRQFDDLAKKLATGLSRRHVLTGFAASLLGSAGGLAGPSRTTDAAGCKRQGNRCTNEAECCSGLCAVDQRGHGHCGACPDQDCAQYEYFDPQDCQCHCNYGREICGDGRICTRPDGCVVGCPPGLKLCVESCIPVDACCTGADCGDRKVCDAGSCVCDAGYYVCGSTCCETGQEICDADGKCCRPDSMATTCAGKCGEATNNCGQPVTCPTCPACQRCTSDNTCAAIANTTSCGTSGICCGGACIEGGECCAAADCQPTTDQCYEAPQCVQHQCSYPFSTPGTPCDDDDRCTQSDACDGSGNCIGGNPVACTDQDACHHAGACDSTTGQCPAQTLRTGYCFIDNTCYSSGDPNPTVACQVCDPASATNDWTTAPDTTPCPAGPHQTGLCQQGACHLTCDTGFAHCTSDPNDGCETDILTDPANCNGCGQLCSTTDPNATAICDGGQCIVICNIGFMPVDGTCCQQNAVCGPIERHVCCDSSETCIDEECRAADDV